MKKIIIVTTSTLALSILILVVNYIIVEGVLRGMINEAILTCVGAVVFLLVGIYDLLGELITIGRRIEDSFQSKSH